MTTTEEKKEVKAVVQEKSQATYLYLADDNIPLPETHKFIKITKMCYNFEPNDFIVQLECGSGNTYFTRKQYIPEGAPSVRIGAIQTTFNILMSRSM